MSCTLCFPGDGYMGVAADFAELYAQHYEAPKEFFYVDMLALIGAAISGRVRADTGLPCQPRLYVCKIAPSAWSRKSTSTRCAEELLRKALSGTGMPETLRGVGSAEGLADALTPCTRRVALIFDELRRFEAKCSIQSSALLPMTNELFESNHYQNRTKGQDVKIENGHLTFLSNSTEQTWQDLHNAAESKDIGFLNRMFLVTGKTDKRIPRPTSPAPQQIQPILADLSDLFSALPALNADGSASSERVLPFTPQAQETWDTWYLRLEQSAETARLDTIGLRLFSLLAFTSGKQSIDEDVVRATLAILDYQQHVRTLYAPIEASNLDSRMEEKIRRVLSKGPQSERDLQRFTNAHRDGLRVFVGARDRMQNAKEIRSSGIEETP
jgi:Protein of unknown function (DUF3987)